ncbi:MAG TPA: hypothetical protein VJQ83_06700 [Tepidiformaceae bacterium]|nr:hypothetical protein [Tepidiformaceae bacterium]
MFAEFEAEAYKVLVAETPDRKFRREYYQDRTATSTAAKPQRAYRQPEQVGVREATLLKVARFIRLA